MKKRRISNDVSVESFFTEDLDTVDLTGRGAVSRGRFAYQESTRGDGVKNFVNSVIEKYVGLSEIPVGATHKIDVDGNVFYVRLDGYVPLDRSRGITRKNRIEANRAVVRKAIDEVNYGSKVKVTILNGGRKGSERIVSFSDLIDL
ncbi:hypothetical protein COU74_04730 [Candidatus Peregrinibacteria bacterium CG10_big_fil_rev_8_21_14_0_10_36_19]|nr:MAG: hypothetical protein COU74_04730 [Candidatus Peregrinibacteria bacterium CG10_big_fil_rev_8_21_14_0_10_36_19]